MFEGIFFSLTTRDLGLGTEPESTVSINLNRTNITSRKADSCHGILP